MIGLVVPFPSRNANDDQTTESMEATDRPSRFGPGPLRGSGLQPACPAQDDTNEPGADEKGRPFDGYLGTITLLLLALFIVGKSARR